MEIINEDLNKILSSMGDYYLRAEDEIVRNYIASISSHIQGIMAFDSELNYEEIYKLLKYKRSVI